MFLARGVYWSSSMNHTCHPLVNGGFWIMEAFLRMGIRLYTSRRPSASVSLLYGRAQIYENDTIMFKLHPPFHSCCSACSANVYFCLAFYDGGLLNTVLGRIRGSLVWRRISPADIVAAQSVKWCKWDFMFLPIKATCFLPLELRPGSLVSASRVVVGFVNDTSICLLSRLQCRIERFPCIQGLRRVCSSPLGLHVPR